MEILLQSCACSARKGIREPPSGLTTAHAQIMSPSLGPHLEGYIALGVNTGTSILKKHPCKLFKVRFGGGLQDLGLQGYSVEGLCLLGDELLNSGAASRGFLQES